MPALYAAATVTTTLTMPSLALAIINKGSTISLLIALESLIKLFIGVKEG